MGFSLGSIGSAIGTAFGGPAGAVAGGILGSVGDQLSANSASSKSKREAERQRAWQSSMSNTAHQREVEDLIAAGINPIMTATGGIGASTGSSGLASSFVSGSYGTGVSNATSAYARQTERKLAEAQIGNLASVTAKNEADAYLSTINAQNAQNLFPVMMATQQAQADMYRSQALQGQQNAMLAALRMPQAQAEAAMYDTPFGRALPYVNAVTGTLGQIVGTGKDVVGAYRGFRPAGRTTFADHFDGSGVWQGRSSYSTNYY